MKMCECFAKKNRCREHYLQRNQFLFELEHFCFQHKFCCFSLFCLFAVHTHGSVDHWTRNRCYILIRACASCGISKRHLHLTFSCSVFFSSSRRPRDAASRASAASKELRSSMNRFPVEIMECWVPMTPISSASLYHSSAAGPPTFEHSLSPRHIIHSS